MPRITPERYLLLVETGDEVLDYREAVARYAGARRWCVEGGDHSLQSFPEHMPRILEFCPMQLLYEEDGELKVGAVLAPGAGLVPGREPARPALQDQGGERAALVRAARRRPSCSPGAQKFAAGLDADFLWECSGAREFGFQDLAREYVGREPTPVEAAGVLLKLHSAPMYFYRRGKGRFQAAPEETLKLALAGRGEEEARAGADRGLGRARWRASSARRRSRALQRRAALRARPQQAGDQGASSRPARQSGPVAGAAASSAAACCRQPRVPPASASCTSSSRAGRCFRRTRCRRCRRTCRCAEARGLQPGRHRHHRDRRRLLGAAAAAGECASASTSRRRRSASRPARRSTRSRASGCRPPTCRGASSPCCPRT